MCVVSYVLRIAGGGLWAGRCVLRVGVGVLCVAYGVFGVMCLCVCVFACLCTCVCYVFRVA